MKPARVISLVIGSFLALVGFGLLAGGGALGWAQATQRDDAGFFTTSTERFATDSFALTSAPVDLGDPGPNAFGEWANGVVRVRVDGVGSGEVFVGIARDADVEAYRQRLSRQRRGTVPDRSRRFQSRPSQGVSLVPNDAMEATCRNDPREVSGARSRPRTSM